MKRTFDLNDKDDITLLNDFLNQYGISFELNLFDQPYMILDEAAFRHAKGIGGRPPRITDDIKYKVIQMKKDGLSTRQIATILSISIGLVSNITKSL